MAIFTLLCWKIIYTNEIQLRTFRQIFSYYILNAFYADVYFILKTRQNILFIMGLHFNTLSIWNEILQNSKEPQYYIYRTTHISKQTIANSHSHWPRGIKGRDGSGRVSAGEIYTGARGNRGQWAGGVCMHARAQNQDGGKGEKSIQFVQRVLTNQNWFDNEKSRCVPFRSWKQHNRVYCFKSEYNCSSSWRVIRRKIETVWEGREMYL